GTQRLERTAPDRYHGLMKVGLGPISAAEFVLAVALTEQRPPERYAMRVDARGALGFVAGTAHVQLAAAPRGGTTMSYRAELRLGGTLAAVGQRLLESAGRMMSRQGLKALDKALRARLGERRP
ncbi:MAG: SRPBCC domain-containing protein, partial [Gemmatimonadales bacterium]